MGEDCGPRQPRVVRRDCCLRRRRGVGAHVEADRAAARNSPFAVLLDAGRCGGTAARIGGPCIALLVPGATEQIADGLGRELEKALRGEAVVVVSAVWQAGESGEDVIDRAANKLLPAVRS